MTKPIPTLVGVMAPGREQPLTVAQVSTVIDWLVARYGWETHEMRFAIDADAVTVYRLGIKPAYVVTSEAVHRVDSLTGDRELTHAMIRMDLADALAENE